MPANFLMSWEPGSRRWWKQYNGKRYVVSCRQLKAPPTKEGSYPAANAWWRAKQVELDGQCPQTRHPHQAILDDLEVKRSWAKRHGQPDVIRDMDDKIKLVSSMYEEPSDFARRVALYSDDTDLTIRAIRSQGGHVPDLDPELIDILYGQSRVWDDRLSRDNTESTPQEQTIQGFADRYIGIFSARHRADNLSAHEADAVRRHVQNFTDWIGPGNPPTLITAERWEGYWTHLLTRIAKGEVSPATVKKDWSHSKRFIQWLSTVSEFVLPKNLNNRGYKFGGSSKAIETFTRGEVTKVVEAAPGQLKLHLLLVLNCGFYQSDIASLTHSEVNWTNGTITRQRTKTRGQHGESVPTVTYPLWPQTFALLSRYRSDHPTLALVTARGKPWLDEQLVDGKLKRRDPINANYRHIQRRLEIDKPLKLLRKTAATMLDNHGEYALYATHFLGHAPDSVASISYVRPSQVRFGEAVKWLGKQFGFSD